MIVLKVQRIFCKVLSRVKHFSCEASLNLFTLEPRKLRRNLIVKHKL